MAEASDKGRRVFDFSKPIDLNTLIVLLGFLGGGAMFVASTRADIAEVKATLSMQGTALDKLGNRIDTLFALQRQVRE